MYIFNNPDCHIDGLVSTFTVSPCSDFGLIEIDENSSGSGSGSISDSDSGDSNEFLINNGKFGRIYDPITNITDCIASSDNGKSNYRRVIQEFELGKCSKESNKLSYLYEMKYENEIPKKVEGNCNYIQFFYDENDGQVNCNFTKIRSYRNETCYRNPVVSIYEKLYCINDTIVTLRCGNDDQCNDINCKPFAILPSNSNLYDEKCKDYKLIEHQLPPPQLTKQVVVVQKNEDDHLHHDSSFLNSSSQINHIYSFIFNFIIFNFLIILFN